VDGTAGIAGVFMVLDTNVRMSPEVRALQQDLAARLDFRRSTQAHGPDASLVNAALDVLVKDLALDGASLSVASNGQAAIRSHRGSHDDTTRLPIASATKWASALVLARLVEQGTLRWDTRVGEWYPQAPAATRGITLEQLFSHTSGLPADDEGCVAQPFDSLQRCAEDILARPLIAPPGQAFAYGSQSMQVAGAIAERASGLAWDDLFRREVAGPLGLVASDYAAGSTRPGYVSLPNPRIDGGLRSTLADYARIVAMWAADGRVDGADYLRPATLRAMERDRTQGLPRLQVPPGATIYPGYGYGFGFWTLPTTRAGNPTVFASPGAFGFTPWVDGAAGIAGVLMVRDQNIRVAPYAKAIIEASAAAFQIQRRTQGAAAPTPPLPARAPGSAQQRLQRRPDVVAKPGLHSRHRVDAVGLEAVTLGGDGLEQEGQ
jgi:CubicO group peptidase (beta-lactamase class C family)